MIGLPGERAVGDPIPVTVIGGYLGAGKTTLLNAMLGNPGGRKIGVVVNDFGALGVDAGLVRAHAGDAPVINLANGCVCCTLGDDLGTTLRTLAAVEPPLDQIVVEASGVADPMSVAAWGTVAPFAPGGVVVAAAVDSVRRSARDRYVSSEVLRQLSCADLIVLTKVDVATGHQVSEVRAWIASVSGAPIVESEMGDVDIDILLGPVTRSDAVAALTAVEHTSSNYVKWAWTPVGPVSASKLEEFLALLPEGVLRLKGVVAVRGEDGVERRLVQVVGRTLSVVPAPPNAPLGFEAIGIAALLDVADLQAGAVRYLDRR